MASRSNFWIVRANIYKLCSELETGEQPEVVINNRLLGNTGESDLDEDKTNSSNEVKMEKLKHKVNFKRNRKLR